MIKHIELGNKVIEYNNHPTEELEVAIDKLNKQVYTLEKAANKKIQSTVFYDAMSLEKFYWYSTIEEFMNIDFTTKGLISFEKYKTKGVKDCVEYLYKNKLAIKKSFYYTNKGVDIKFEYFDSDTNVVFFKDEFKPLGIVQIAKITKANRDRTITYLQASAKDTPIESYVNSLLKHYKEEIDLFIYNDTDDFKNAVNNETEQPFINYLGIVIESPSTNYPTGKTVKDSILKEIN